MKDVCYKTFWTVTVHSDMEDIEPCTSVFDTVEDADSFMDRMKKLLPADDGWRVTRDCAVLNSTTYYDWFKEEVLGINSEEDEPAKQYTIDKLREVINNDLIAELAKMFPYHHKYFPDSFMDDVIEDVYVASSWQDDGDYTDGDIRSAIQRQILIAVGGDMQGGNDK